MSLYDMSEIESLIQRHAPALMRNAAALPEDREEPKPKRNTAREKWIVVTPEVGAMIDRMHELGTGTTDIAAALGINYSTVRDRLRKVFVKNTAAQTKLLRSGPFSGVKRVSIK